MSNTYSVRTSVGEILRELNELQKWAVSENVTIHGRGSENYAYDRNQNLVYMLENFAGSPAPSTPLDGQLWWDVNNTALRVWNDVGSPQSKWDPVVPGSAGVGFYINAGDGLKYVGSPANINGALPTGSPLTIELEVGTGETTLQNIVSVNMYGAANNLERIITSQDGLSWTVQETSTTVYFGIAYSPTVSRFVTTLGNRSVRTSDDGGVTWVTQSNVIPASTGTENWEKINWIDELGMFFVANNDNAGSSIAYSTDGINWTLVPATQTPLISAQTIQYYEFDYITSLGRVVLYAPAGSNFYIAHSTDGITWTDILAHTGNDPAYSSYPATGYSPVLDEILSIESSGSSFTTPILRRYDVGAAGSPLFDPTGWTSANGPFGPWSRNGDYQYVNWISAGSPQCWLVTGKADSSGFSDNAGSPFTGASNFLSGTDSVNWNRIGGMEPIIDTGPGTNGASQPFVWSKTVYIPSLDKVLALAGTHQSGSPSTYLMRLSGPINGRTRNITGGAGQWTKVDIPEVTATAGFAYFDDVAFGEVTLTGVSVDANSISIDESTLNHDALSGYVSTEHTDHSNVTLSGNGMSSIGNLTASRTLNIVGGDGITANANDIQVDSTVVRTSSGWAGGIYGVKTFEAAGSIRAPDGTAALPGFTFYIGNDDGIYRSGANELSFSTNGQGRFSILSTGVMRALDTTYEVLVTQDDDIPNKKYVDDAAAGATGVITENTFTARGFGGILSISGLNPGSKYLVGVFGIIRNNGTGSGTHGGIRVTSQHNNPPTAGMLYQGPLHGGVNWPDGNAPQHQWCVITAPAGGTIYGYTDYRDNTPPAIEWRYAMHMTAVQLD